VRDAVDTRREAAQPRQPVSGSGALCQSCATSRSGRQHDARQVVGGVVEALEADELVHFVGDDALAVGALARVVQAHEQHLRLNPVAARPSPARA
jgi:hypothetical protein